MRRKRGNRIKKKDRRNEKIQTKWEGGNENEKLWKVIGKKRSG